MGPMRNTPPYPSRPQFYQWKSCIPDWQKWNRREQAQSTMATLAGGGSRKESSRAGASLSPVKALTLTGTPSLSMQHRDGEC